MINAKWLSEGEWVLYDGASEHEDFLVINALESLAAQRELMKKHQYYKHWNPDRTRFTERCNECHQRIDRPCDVDCAWAKQIDGFPREVE